MWFLISGFLLYIVTGKVIEIKSENTDATAPHQWINWGNPVLVSSLDRDLSGFLLYIVTGKVIEIKSENTDATATHQWINWGNLVLGSSLDRDFLISLTLSLSIFFINTPACSSCSVPLDIFTTPYYKLGLNRKIRDSSNKIFIRNFFI